MRMLCILLTAGMIPLWFALWGGKCRQRVLVLEDLLHAAQDLKHYAAATGDCIEAVLRRADMRSFFVMHTRDRFLENLASMQTDAAWENAVTEELWKKRSACGITPADRTVLQAMGRGMGSFFSRQQELLSGAEEELEQLLADARACAEKTRGLYRRLGWIAAGAAVILLW